jgi:5-methyltetrahydrofolate--homocysteine methyltransferase
VILLDGAMGTALLDAGLPAASPPELWLLERPDEIRRVHAAHAAAGAEVVLTCTFNLASARLRRGGVAAPVPELARRAVEAARAGAAAARVAGAVGPAAIAPGGEAAPGDAYAEAFQALAAAGVDLLWTESHWDLAEARTALAAARATGLPAVLTFTFATEGGALVAASGEPAAACLEAVAADGAAAVGANCLLRGTPLPELLAEVGPRLRVPLVAKPSAGLPGAIEPAAAFASWCAELAAAGARWVGGCCGAGPEHLAAAARALSSVRSPTA